MVKGAMSNLTSKLEEAFGRIYDLLDAAGKGEDISPLAVKDALRDLEAEVEAARVKAGRCAICEAEFPPLCGECLEEEETRWIDWRDELSLRHLVNVGVG
jgi:hypothetical protein